MVGTKVYPFNKRSLKDPFLTKGCSRGKYHVTRDPKGMATVLYDEPAKAGCMRSLAVDNSPCSSRLAHRVFFLYVKSTVASGQNRLGMLAHTSATRLCCFEQPIAPSTRACIVWLYATTSCKMMLLSLQKSTISCEVFSCVVNAKVARSATCSSDVLFQLESLYLVFYWDKWPSTLYLCRVS